jgi:hypothetical protein
MYHASMSRHTVSCLDLLYFSFTLAKVRHNANELCVLRFGGEGSGVFIDCEKKVNYLAKLSME